MNEYSIPLCMLVMCGVCVVCVCRNKEPQSVDKDRSGVFDSITASTTAQGTSNNTTQLSLPLTHTPQTTTAHTAQITPANLIS